jgi:hypothetical protein
LSNKISKCDICSASFGSKKELRDHKDNSHSIADYLTVVTSGAAERIVDRILYSIKDGRILGVAVIGRKGISFSLNLWSLLKKYLE